MKLMQQVVHAQSAPQKSGKSWPSQSLQGNFGLPLLLLSPIALAKLNYQQLSAVIKMQP